MHNMALRLSKVQFAVPNVDTMKQNEELALLSLAVLSPELLDLDLNLLVDTGSELGTVPKLEKNLEPYKHRSQEDGLDKVVE